MLWFSLKKLRDVLIIYTGIPLAAVGRVLASTVLTLLVLPTLYVVIGVRGRSDGSGG